MITIIVGPHKFVGSLNSFDREGEDLVFNFELRDPDFIKLVLPKAPPELISAVTNLGIDYLRDATIDLNKGRIESNKEIAGGKKIVSLRKE